MIFPLNTNYLQTDQAQTVIEEMTNISDPYCSKAVPIFIVFVPNPKRERDRDRQKDTERKIASYSLLFAFLFTIHSFHP